MVVPSPAEIEYQLAHIHENRSANLIISHALCLPLAVTAVILRFISRRSIKARLQADDWLIIAALSLYTGQITSGFLAVRFGAGRHAVLLQNPVPFAKMVIAIGVLYSFAIAAVKLSVLLMYRRLFPNRRFQIILWCFGAFILCYTTSQALVIIFNCQPIEAAWEPLINGKCTRLDTNAIVVGSLNVVTDLVTVILPMPFLWRLQISTERKFQLIGIFLTGGM